MKILMDVMDDMCDELHDAKHRIKRAYKMKVEHPELAKREYEIAVQELQHADKDHLSATELIAAYKKEKGETPVYMMEMWNDKHDKYIEKYAIIKNMIDLYNK